MPIEASYKTYYGIHLNHYDYDWAGETYNKILTQEYPSDELVSTASTQASSAVFIYPRLVGNPCYIDGLAEGHFTLFNSSSAASSTVSTYTVSLMKTNDVPENETIIGTYTYTLTADNIIWKSGEVSDDGFNSDVLVLPIYMPIVEQRVDVDEKLLLKIEYTSSSGTVWIGHYNGGDPDDIKFRIPYTPTG